jgi:hypothetical protein
MLIYKDFCIAEFLGKGAAALAARALATLHGDSIHRLVHRFWG